MRFLILLVLAGMLAGCTLRDPRDATGPGWGEKAVAAKEPPRRLVAFDGTYCDVSRERYEETRYGEAVYCRWRARHPGHWVADRPLPPREPAPAPPGT